MAFWGLFIIAVLLVLIMSKKVSVIVALIGTPVIFGLIAGLGSNLGEYMLAGLKSVAPTGIMLMFAMLYFSVMNDAGMFQPIIKGMLHFGGQDPVKIVLATGVIAIVSHLDGSGASTFLITVPALLPIYNRFKIHRSVLACMVALGAGTMNIVPWGGPALRAATSLELDMAHLFNPVVPSLIAGLLTVLGIGFFLGRKEKYRLSETEEIILEDSSQSIESPQVKELQRPKLFLFNLALTILAIVTLVMRLLPQPTVFVIALAIALAVNYPNVKMQHQRITAHGKSIILMIAIIFSAGIFTGILKNSGMIKALAEYLVSIVPRSLGSHLPILTALTSMPASLIFDPDSYYFGVLPVLAAVAENLGTASVEIARAAILGQMTTGFPVSPLTASTFLLMGLAGVDLADHQKKTIPLAFMVTFVMTITALIFGAISL